jgi:gamma-glutamyltranspeptidase
MVYKHIALTLFAFSAAVSTSAATVQSTGKHGAVASEVSECSAAGLEILKAGGSAADGVRMLLSKTLVMPNGTVRRSLRLRFA